MWRAYIDAIDESIGPLGRRRSTLRSFCLLSCVNQPKTSVASESYHILVSSEEGRKCVQQVEEEVEAVDPWGFCRCPRCTSVSRLRTCGASGNPRSSTGNCSFILTWLSGVRKRNFRVFVRSCFTDASSYISTDCMEHYRRRNKWN